MGYQPKRHVYVLEFEDEEFDGLEVRAASAPLGTFLDMTALAKIGSNPNPEDVAKVGDLLIGFAGVLRSWNVEDDGIPMPPTAESLRKLEFPFVFQIIAAWIKATAGVAAPLGQLSDGGGPSVAASIPMVPLSGSRAS